MASGCLHHVSYRAPLISTPSMLPWQKGHIVGGLSSFGGPKCGFSLGFRLNPSNKLATPVTKQRQPHICCSCNHLKWRKAADCRKRVLLLYARYVGGSSACVQGVGGGGRCVCVFVSVDFFWGEGKVRVDTSAPTKRRHIWLSKLTLLQMVWA